MRYATLSQFYPFYLKEHSDPKNRRLHVLGTGLVILLLIGAVVTGNLWLLLGIPVAGYGFAWAGHFFFERNTPATFTQPLFSFISDFLMFRDVLLRRLPPPGGAGERGRRALQPPLIRHLATYAASHRDRRNVATHMIGIPLIVLGVETLLSRGYVIAGPLTLTFAMLISIAAASFYLYLDLAFGSVMAILLGLAVWFGLTCAGLPASLWLGIGAGLFVIGWIAQFIGHGYEGKRPTFFNDLIGLVIGPLFIVVEMAFAMGLRHGTRDALDAALAKPSQRAVH